MLSRDMENIKKEILPVEIMKYFLIFMFHV